ncbi:hypothetical protein [Latilactobacillus sakei]|uniref:Sakacin D98c n=1 Tax=Latilactobacillus sakei TaxID=1599 RepID=U6BYS2_LATSK|nr:sakacin D98c [Latilactobacillus sakei]
MEKYINIESRKLSSIKGGAAKGFIGWLIGESDDIAKGIVSAMNSDNKKKHR